MRIRSAFAIALLATGSGAPALAAQLPAREVEFVSFYQDPYEAFEGVPRGLATQIISRAGWIFAAPVGSLHGVAASFIAPPSLETAVSGNLSSSYCYSSNHCRRAAAINDEGRIVGDETYFFPGWDNSRPYQGRVDALTDTVLEFQYLNTPPGYPAQGNGVRVHTTAINADDLIAGYASRGFPAYPSPVQEPIWWPSPGALALVLPQTPGLNAGPFPARINRAGVIVGNTAGSAPVRAAVWRPTYTGYVLALLGELPGGTSSVAYDIGFFGGIVGSSDDGSGTQVAVIWRPTGVGYTVTPLPVPEDGSCSAATAINTNGDIAGNCTLGNGAERGVVWRKLGGSYELLHELEPLQGHTRSIAYALDDDGQAGGGSGPVDSERAVLWPVVVAAPVSVPALSHGALLCLAAVIAVATAATLRAR